MFISLSGERFHVLLHGALGAWVISYDFYGMPVYLDKQHLERSERIEAPEEYVANRKREMTDAQRKRYDLLKPVLEDSRCITDSGYRQECFRRIILAHNTSKRRLERLYYSYLAHGCLTQSKPRESRRRKDFDDAIRKYYFTAKRNSLRTAYELFILEHYTNNGDVQKDTPSWAAFKHYYYRHWGQDKQKDISRNGLTDYQRNNRPLYSSAMQYRDCLGCYQIDETPGDIYLVSKWDRCSVIGRPNVYLAVDTASGLIAGLYVGLEAGERAVASCLANCCADKVVYCQKYGIEIDPADWPSRGLPSEIISDRGNEFTGDQMDEMCLCYGIDCQTLPPFRAEEKPLVERAMGLIQDSYKSVLRGRGVIGEDVAERWSTDYRKQAILTLDEYTAIVIHCVVALNKGRVLSDIGHLPVDAPNTPARLWGWMLENGKSNLLEVDEREVYLRSLPREKTKVTRKGIIFNGMRYLPERGTELTIGESIEFAYDVADSSVIYALRADRRLLPCYLAQSNSRYKGYDHSDVSVMHRQEAEQERDARQDEFVIRVKMHDEIQKIVQQAEDQREAYKDVSDISQNREWERSRLT